MESFNDDSPESMDIDRLTEKILHESFGKEDVDKKTKDHQLKSKRKLLEAVINIR